MHIHLIIEIDAQSSVKPTQRPLVAGVEEDALPMILLGSCKKSGCVSYMVCVFILTFTSVMIKNAYTNCLNSLNLTWVLKSSLQIAVL